MTDIADIHAREILDSRGNPTVEVEVTLDSGAIGPRGGAVGGLDRGARGGREARRRREALWRARRARGGGQCQRRDFRCASRVRRRRPARIDRTLIELDGTPNKGRLGANAVLGVSLACAKASAIDLDQPLWRYVGGVFARTLPVPMMNIVNGGVHADNPIDIQEFMIMPVGAPSCADAIRMGSEIFHALRRKLHDAGHNTNVGDEGGFAPNLASADAALSLCHAGDRERPATVPARMSCWRSTRPRPSSTATADITSKARARCSIAPAWSPITADLVARYPIVSIEDGMAEDDWEGWALLTRELGARVQLVGDDAFVTNPKRLRDGIAQGVGNAVLVKVNQIGTLSETLETIEIATRAGYGSVMSHRSGETEDTTIADLAVATNCGQIKTGSLSRSDRLAKYNQLIRIEEQLGDSALYPGRRVLRG